MSRYLSLIIATMSMHAVNEVSIDVIDVDVQSDSNSTDLNRLSEFICIMNFMQSKKQSWNKRAVDNIRQFMQGLFSTQYLSGTKRIILVCLCVALLIALVTIACISMVLYLKYNDTVEAPTNTCILHNNYSATCYGNAVGTVLNHCTADQINVLTAAGIGYCKQHMSELVMCVNFLALCYQVSLSKFVTGTVDASAFNMIDMHNQIVRLNSLDHSIYTGSFNINNLVSQNKTIFVRENDVIYGRDAVSAIPKRIITYSNLSVIDTNSVNCTTISSDNSEMSLMITDTEKCNLIVNHHELFSMLRRRVYDIQCYLDCNPSQPISLDQLQNHQFAYCASSNGQYKIATYTRSNTDVSKTYSASIGTYTVSNRSGLTTTGTVDTDITHTSSHSARSSKTMTTDLQRTNSVTATLSSASKSVIRMTSESLDITKSASLRSAYTQSLSISLSLLESYSSTYALSKTIKSPTAMLTASRRMNNTNSILITASYSNTNNSTLSAYITGSKTYSGNVTMSNSWTASPSASHDISNTSSLRLSSTVSRFSRSFSSWSSTVSWTVFDSRSMTASLSLSLSQNLSRSVTDHDTDSLSLSLSPSLSRSVTFSRTKSHSYTTKSYPFNPFRYKLTYAAPRNIYVVDVYEFNDMLRDANETSIYNVTVNNYTAYLYYNNTQPVDPYNHNIYTLAKLKVINSSYRDLIVFTARNNSGYVTDAGMNVYPLNIAMQLFASCPINTTFSGNFLYPFQTISNIICLVSGNHFVDVNNDTLYVLRNGDYTIYVYYVNGIYLDNNFNPVRATNIYQQDGVSYTVGFVFTNGNDEYKDVKGVPVYYFDTKYYYALPT